MIGSMRDRARELLTPLTAVAAAILVLNLLSWSFGQAPIHTLMTAAAGSWGTLYGIGQVLFKATPLLLAGIAVDVALRAGMFNIGVEGQIAVGSLTGAVVALLVPPWMPRLAAVPLVLFASAFAGGLWAAIPAYMRVVLGAHEVITTIMLNRIADAIIAMLMTSALALPGTVRTADMPPNTLLPRFQSWSSGFNGSAASLAFPLAVGTLALVFLWLRRTRSGRETQWVGLNEHACAAEGIPVGRRRFAALTLSGAMGGLAAAGTVLGYKGYYEMGLGAGVGFGGIAVAFLGRGNPIGLLLAALLFGTLAQAGLAINAQVPREAMGVLEAVVIIVTALAATSGAAKLASRTPPAVRHQESKP